jgi:hypothetical protein
MLKHNEVIDMNRYCVESEILPRPSNRVHASQEMHSYSPDKKGERDDADHI